MPLIRDAATQIAMASATKWMTELNRSPGLRPVAAVLVPVVLMVPPDVEWSRPSRSSLVPGPQGRRSGRVRLLSTGPAAGAGLIRMTPPRFHGGETAGIGRAVGPQVDRRRRLTEIAGFAGGALVTGGMLVLMAGSWSAWTPAGRTATLALIGSALALVGGVLGGRTALRGGSPAGEDDD